MFSARSGPEISLLILRNSTLAKKKKTFVYVNVCECSVHGYGLYAHVVQRPEKGVR